MILQALRLCILLLFNLCNQTVSFKIVLAIIFFIEMFFFQIFIQMFSYIDKPTRLQVHFENNIFYTISAKQNVRLRIEIQKFKFSCFESMYYVAIAHSMQFHT